MDEQDAQQRLEEAMDQARQDLDIKWVDVARGAGISTETLFRFRKGQRTPDMTRKVERFYGWPRGYIEALANDEPLPAPEPAPLPEPETEPEPQSNEDERAELLEMVRSLRLVAEDLLRRLEERDKRDKHGHAKGA